MKHTKLSPKDINLPLIVGAGLATLDIIIGGQSKKPIYKGGGTCANVLSGLTKAGCKTALIHRNGKDIAGKILLSDFIETGVKTDIITEESNIKTPRIIEYIDTDKSCHKFLMRCPKCHSYLPGFRSPRLDCINNTISKFQSPDVYFFDRITPFTLKLAGIYKALGTLIVFEPYKPKDDPKFYEAVSKCHILKYAGKTTKGETEDSFLTYNIKEFQPALIIKTLGESGLEFKFSDDAKWRYKKGIKAKKVVDCCGAGDWFTVGFIYSLLSIAKNEKRVDGRKLSYILNNQSSVEKALNFGQWLASLSVGFLGARGLSSAINISKFIKNSAESYHNNADIDIFNDKYLDRFKSTNHRKFYERIDKNNLCSLCLMSKVKD